VQTQPSPSSSFSSLAFKDSFILPEQQAVVQFNPFMTPFFINYY